MVDLPDSRLDANQRFRFYSDGNQRQFEWELDDRGVEYRRLGMFETVVEVDDQADWIGEVARMYGGQVTDAGEEDPDGQQPG